MSEIIELVKSATLYLVLALEKLQEAQPRCQNCGKAMDQTECPYCGYVQQ